MTRTNQDYSTTSGMPSRGSGITFDCYRPSMSKLFKHSSAFELPHEECVVCLEIYDPRKVIYSCPCGVFVCNDCFVEWTSQQINNQVLKEQVSWKCPQPNPTVLPKGAEKWLPKGRENFLAFNKACTNFDINGLIAMI